MFQEFEPSNRPRITATEARKSAESNMGLEVLAALDKADADIQKAVNSNSFSCQIRHKLPKAAVKNLEERGFKVVNNSFDYRNEHEDLFEVSW